MSNKITDFICSETSYSQEHFICDICKKTFFTKFHYQIHSVTHLLPAKFANCRECLEGTAHILSLDKHLEIHNNPVCINSLDEHVTKHNNESTNSSIAIQGTDNENFPLNMHNNGILQNLFRCDFCNNEFLEQCHLEEHYQNDCIKKELNDDEYEDFMPHSLLTTVVPVSDSDGGVTSSEVTEKSKNVRLLPAKVPQFVCKICQKVFSNKYSLTIHFSVHSDQKTYKCRLCEKKFTLKCLLNAHLRTHKVKEVFCGVCQKGFTSKEKLFNHVYVHALVESFSCNICQMTFSEKSSLEKHSLRHIAENEFNSQVKHSLNDRLQNLFKCNKCEKEFLEKDDLEEHYWNDCIKEELDSNDDNDDVPPSSEGRKRKSTYSQKAFLETYHLTQTNKKKSGQYFTCEVCQKKFYSKRTLDDHKHIHMGSFPYVCDICSKGFARLDHLKRHHKIHSGTHQRKSSGKKSTSMVSRYVCDVCSKGFGRKDRLKSHYIIHTKIPPKKLSNEPSYFCDVCSEGFFSPDDLQDHYQNHRWLKPWKCETCGKSYAHKTNLTKHQLAHHSVKVKREPQLHACQVCPKTFARLDHLQRHHLIHTGEKPFVCETCGASFNQKSTLNVHQSTHLPKKPKIVKDHAPSHSEQKPFICDVCGRKFALKRYLRTHLRRVHAKKQQSLM